MKRVGVVGAGLSGLAAAYAAKKAGAEVVVFEAGSRVGGAVGTETVDGFRLERGADGFITEKRDVLALADELGLAHRLVKTVPKPQGAHVVRDGRLVPIPPGFQMMAPLDPVAFLKSPILSPLGKLRAMGEILVPKGKPSDGNDESLASFVTRRFGKETLDRLAQPLVSGIYGADPERLSLRSTMPRFLNEERRFGSVTLGLLDQARKARAAADTGARYSLFASFDEGMQVLVDGVADAVGRDRVRLETSVQAIGAREVRTASGIERFDAVVCALPLAASIPALREGYPDVADALSRIELGSCVIVVFAFDREVVPADKDSYGFVVPKVEGREAIAGTFLSRKWAGRAPAGKEALRVFLRDEAVSCSDDRIVETARRELAELLGVRAEPVLVRIHRYGRAMPQYHVGHDARAKAVDALVRKHPELHLAGNALFGVGIPDAVRVGLAAGRAAAQ